jgi:hypothetical protein
MEDGRGEATAAALNESQPVQMPILRKMRAPATTMHDQRNVMQVATKWELP